MRRSAPPPRLRVDPSAVAKGWARVEPGSRGLGLTPASTPDGVRPAKGPTLRISAAAPFPAHEVAVAAGGDLALTVAAGVARTLRLPALVPAFDRRPPGASRVVGAPRANAGLLHDDAGWRAIVLPSLGDLAAALGPGPVALRADGRRLAVAANGGVEERDLPGGPAVARHEGSPGALAYAADGRLIAGLGGAVGAVDGEPSDGSPVVALTTAAEASRALARHADGTLSLWDLDRGGCVGRWPSPLAGPLAIGLSADGARATLGTPFATPAAAALVEAADGAVLIGIDDARGMTLPPSGDGVLIGGDWGVAWLEPPEVVE